VKVPNGSFYIRAQLETEPATALAAVEFSYYRLLKQVAK
jgi:hypothetical protein